MLQATIRRDGSSVFGSDNKWGTFPSASVAWNITEEEVMKNQNIFDQLKLRVGYGVSGNAMGFGAYDAIATYGLNSNSFEYILSDGTKYTMYGIEAQNNPVAKKQLETPDIRFTLSATEVETKLKKQLGAKVKLKVLDSNTGRGRIVIDYKDNTDLDRLLEILCNE